MNETGRAKQTICFIINPISGSGRKRSLIDQIKSALNHGRFLPDFKISEYAGHAIELSKMAVEQNYDIVVAVGGDGTINEVATQLIGKETILGIIPRGSGNGLARHLGIPRTVPAAIKLINKGISTSIDTATINGTPYISIAGIGFDALIAKKFAEHPKRGFLTYFNLVAENYLKYRPKKYKLTFEDGSKVTTRAIFVAFANSNQFGYNTQIAPNALLNDGKLDICIVEKPPLVEIPLIVNLLLLKKIHLSQHVRIIKSSSVSVSRKKGKLVNLDGEPVKMKKSLEIVTHPRSLNVLIKRNGKEK